MYATKSEAQKLVQGLSALCAIALNNKTYTKAQLVAQLTNEVKAQLVATRNSHATEIYINMNRTQRKFTTQI